MTTNKKPSKEDSMPIGDTPVLNYSLPLAERYIQQIKQIINGHTPNEPYSSNTLDRIAQIISDWRKNK